MKADATRGSNWAPAWRRISAMAVARGIPLR